MPVEQIEFSRSEIEAYYAARVPALTRNGVAEWRAPCPIHHGSGPNFSVNPETGLWHCHSECACGGSIIQLEMAINRVDSIAAASSVLSIIGRDWRIIAKYVYRNEAGDPLFRVVRRERGQGVGREKQFYQQRYEDGNWINGLGDVRRVPYHLGELVKSKHVFIVEGEKDVNTIRRKYNLAATTSPMGAGNWSPDYNRYFSGKNVTIIPDNDSAGQKHALRVSEELMAVASSVRMLELPNLPEKGDVTDWINSGGTREQLAALRRGAQPLDDKQLGEIRRRWFSATPATKSVGGFNPVGLDELLSQPEVPIDWVLQDRLTAGNLSLLVSKPKVGKSTLARNLALSVSRGEPFLGWKVKQGPVVYLALEERREDVVADFRAMRATAKDPIRVGHKGNVEEVIDFVLRERPVLMIIDPLVRLLRPMDEKGYSEVYSALGPLIDLARQTGTHILFLHHSPKMVRSDAIDSPLGSTALSAAAATVLVMRQQQGLRTLESSQRIGRNLPETILNFDETKKLLSIGDSRAGAVTVDLGSQILQCLHDTALTEPSIDALVQGKTMIKRKALRNLVKEGRLEKTGTGRRGDPFVYKNARSLVLPSTNNGNKKLPFVIKD